MRITGPITAVLLLAACDSREDRAAPASGIENQAAPAARSEAAAAPTKAAPDASAPRWDLQSSGEGVALALVSAPERTTIRLFCPARAGRLLVNVPGFRAVGSEERLSVGSGGNAHALVADSRGDRERGGVSASGDVPDDLASLVGGPVSASYGAQSTGPHPAPPRELSGAFVAACRERAGAAAPPGGARPGSAVGACMIQGSEHLSLRPLRAVGTEPFWGARIEGRCVTYSHPEDQAGTRIWTRYTAGPNGGGTWSGALGGRRFELRTSPRPGCSDGMSDKVYPIAVDLVVGAERRSGCAEPA